MRRCPNRNCPRKPPGSPTISSFTSLGGSPVRDARRRPVIPTYHGFVERREESDLYAAYQQRFLERQKQCDIALTEIIRELVPYDVDLRLIDVGCGNGQCLVHLSRTFPSFDLVGADLCLNALAHARTAAPNARFEVCDIFDLPYEHEFDFVICKCFLYAFSNEEFERALAVVRRLLRPGGFAIVFDLFHPWEQMLEVIERTMMHPEGHPLIVRPFSYVRSAAHDAGLQTLEFRTFHVEGLPRPVDPHDFRSYDHAGLVMRGSFNQPFVHAVFRAP